MKSLLITTAATTAALIVVFSTRLVVPALILVFRQIEAGFAPAEEPVIAGVLPVSVTPLEIVSEPIEERHEQSTNRTNNDTAAPRKARRRKPSAKTLARAEAALA